MTPILLTEDLSVRKNRSAQDLDAVRLGAEQAGFKVCRLPVDDRDLGAFSELLDRANNPAIFSGYLISRERYAKIEAACAAQGIRMINSVTSSRRVMHLSSYQPLISDLGAETVFLEQDASLNVFDANFPKSSLDVFDGTFSKSSLEFPVFVKGDIKSDKESGPSACIAADQTDLARIVAALRRSGEDLVAVRDLLKLRSKGQDARGFPIAREYRLFFYQDQLLGYGFYWPGNDPFGQLSSAEKRQISSLARTVTERLDCPLLAVDVGQLENGSWTVIEVGDPQFARINQHMPPLVYFNKLADLIR